MKISQVVVPGIFSPILSFQFTCYVLLLMPDIAFFQAVCMHRWFHSRDSRNDNFHARCFTVWLEVYSRVGWVSHFLARYNTRYVAEKSSTDANCIAWKRFASNLLSSFEGFKLQQLCSKLWLPVPRDVCRHVVTSGQWNGLKKSHFNRRLGSDNINNNETVSRQILLTSSAKWSHGERYSW